LVQEFSNLRALTGFFSPPIGGVQLLDDGVHDVNVLPGGDALVIEVKPLLHLLPQLDAKS
jgi:hypothetical protein